MAQYNAIKAAVNAYIKANGRKEITGQILNSVLNATIDSLGRFFQFAGEAYPSTDPGTPDQNVTYLAGTAGTYTNFGGLTLDPQEIALLMWDGEWRKHTMLIGIQEVEASVDNQVGTPSVDVNYANGHLELAFHNMKGQQGDAAGFGSVTADVDANIGTPGVSVETSGANTSKNFTFHFTNLKGKKGDTGVTEVNATIDNNTGVPYVEASLSGQVLTLHFHNMKGEQGNTGSSVSYPFTLVNNVTTNDATQGLTAAMGVYLQEEIIAEKTKIDGIPVYDEVIVVPVTQGTSIGTGTKHDLNSPMLAGKEYTIKLTGYSGIVSSFTIYIYDENGSGVNGSWDGGSPAAYKSFSAGHWERTLIPSSDIHKIAFYLTSANAIGTGDLTLEAFKPGFTGIQEKVDTLMADTEGYDQELDGDNTTSGNYRNKNGVVTALSGYFYSDPIAVKEGDKFVADSVSSASAQDTIAMLSWVDDSNNFISLILHPSSAGSYEYIFPQAGHICISGAVSDLAKFSVKIIGLSAIVPILKVKVDGVEKYVNGYENGLDSDNTTGGYYRNKSGNITALSGFFYSDPIRVKAGDKFVADSVSSGSAQDSVAMLSWVDNDNNFISLILHPNTAGTYEYPFVEAGYVCISGTIADRAKFKVQVASLEDTDTALSEQIDILREDVNGRYDSVRLPALTDNPVERINFNCGLVGIFKTIGVIGDSLASGEMQGYHTDGTLYYRDMYELSWGQQIAKMTGVDVFNFSQGGQYAKGWMNGNTARTWDANDVAGGAHSNKKQCYLIGFAHNDKTKVEDNTYSAGVGTIADINDGDYTQNADSFVGWYARIIQALKTIEPRAYIFCITPPSVNYDAFSAQIRDIVDHFAGSRVYLIDLRRYGMSRSNPLFVMGNHQSAAGYLYDAYEIANYMDWIIRSNPTDFKYTSLVGTDILDTDPTP